MSQIVFLDAGPLGLVTNPRLSASADSANRWLELHLVRGTRLIIPEITDYEVRRELIRAGRQQGVMRLDALQDVAEYLPLNSAMMRRAAQLWAEARRRGRPTADVHALDGDVILAAQAQLLAEQSADEVVVATTNAAHLAQFVAAHHWRDIPT